MIYIWYQLCCRVKIVVQLLYIALLQNKLSRPHLSSSCLLPYCAFFVSFMLCQHCLQKVTREPTLPLPLPIIFFWSVTCVCACDICIFIFLTTQRKCEGSARKAILRYTLPSKTERHCLDFLEKRNAKINIPNQLLPVEDITSSDCREAKCT